MPEDEKDQPQTEQTPKGLTVPVPKRDEFLGNLKKVAQATDDPRASTADADAALARAWRLGDADYTDEVMDEFEQLLPALVAAGYAERHEHTWNFTPRGVARAEALAPDR